MPNKLHDRLDHNEKILFESRYTLVQAIERAFGSGIVLLAAVWIIGQASDDVSEIYGELVFFALFAVAIAIQLRVAAVLVTDRRVLYRRSLWRWKIIETPLSDISQIDYAPGTFGLGDVVSARMYNFQIIQIRLVPKLDDLCDTILALKGLPVPTRMKPRIRNAYNLMGAAAIGCGLLGGGVCGFVVLSMIGSYDPLEGSIAVIVILFILFLFLPLMLVSLVLGFIVGPILFLILARFHMSLSEMKELICMDDGSLHGVWMERLNRWCVRYLERFVSFLYGHKIRCD